MPQLKKLSSSILPKIKIENVYTNFEGTQMDTSPYLVPLYCDMSSNSLLTSEAESDGADSLPSKPRKRQRLDHLSQEEKIMRRKMKNRVAAQTARDRKKAKMAELEDQVLELETEKQMLLLANTNLRLENETLQEENAELKRRLSKSVSNDVKVEEPSPVSESEVESEAESRLSDSSRSLEHAEGTGSAKSYSLDDSFNLFTSSSETDALLNLLEQCGKDLLQFEDFTTFVPEDGERGGKIPTSEMVGTSSKCMESHKELIHFDHIYFKQEDDQSIPVDTALSSTELSTKDCSMDISSPLSEDFIVEAVNSPQIPVICISDTPDLKLPSDFLQFENVNYAQFDNPLLLVDSKPVPSPVSSDGGYDSSFSASSPSSSAANPWDDTLTELFPSLV